MDNSIKAAIYNVDDLLATIDQLQAELAAANKMIALAEEDFEFMLDDYDNRVYVYSENMGRIEEMRTRWVTTDVKEASDEQ